MIKHLENLEQFDEIIKGNVLIDFFATWCGPCRMLTEELIALDEEGFTKDIEIYKVDVDQFPELARRFGIQTIPMMMHFVNSNRQEVINGYINKNEIKKLLIK